MKENDGGRVETRKVNMNTFCFCSMLRRVFSCLSPLRWQPLFWKSTVFLSFPSSLAAFILKKHSFLVFPLFAGSLYFEKAQFSCLSPLRWQPLFWKSTVFLSFPSSLAAFILKKHSFLVFPLFAGSLYFEKAQFSCLSPLRWQPLFWKSTVFLSFPSSLAAFILKKHSFLVFPLFAGSLYFEKAQFSCLSPLRWQPLFWKSTVFLFFPSSLAAFILKTHSFPVFPLFAGSLYFEKAQFSCLSPLRWQPLFWKSTVFLSFPFSLAAFILKTHSFPVFPLFARSLYFENAQFSCLSPLRSQPLFWKSTVFLSFPSSLAAFILKTHSFPVFPLFARSLYFENAQFSCLSPLRSQPLFWKSTVFLSFPSSLAAFILKTHSFPVFPLFARSLYFEKAQFSCLSPLRWQPLFWKSTVFLSFPSSLAAFILTKHSFPVFPLFAGSLYFEKAQFSCLSPLRWQPLFWKSTVFLSFPSSLAVFILTKHSFLVFPLFAGSLYFEKAQFSCLSPLRWQPLFWKSTVFLSFPSSLAVFILTKHSFLVFPLFAGSLYFEKAQFSCLSPLRWQPLFWQSSFLVFPLFAGSLYFEKAQFSCLSPLRWQPLFWQSTVFVVEQRQRCFSWNLTESSPVWIFDSAHQNCGRETKRMLLFKYCS